VSRAVLVWGDNSAGSVGVGVTKTGRHIVKPRQLPQLSEVVAIDVSCGSAHTLLLTSEGTLFVWGDGKAGQVHT
jgi:alpha-tubulin suppressor-like RCC1 family protein